MNRLFFYMLLIFTVLSMNCKDDGGNPTGGGTPDGEDLPVKTINYVVDTATGYWRFYTNDTAYCAQSGGNAFHHIFDTVYSPFDSVETEVIKNSGSQFMYGIEFCIQDNGDLYRLLINTNRAYEVFKHVSGVNSWYNFNTSTWSSTNSFTYPTSSALRNGFGMSNKLKIVAVGGGIFDVYFNGIKSASFSESSFAAGRVGFVTFVGTKTDEYFPNYPVEVLFKQLVAN
jgi:hypothetical protein